MARTDEVYDLLLENESGLTAREIARGLGLSTTLSNMQVVYAAISQLKAQMLDMEMDELVVNVNPGHGYTGPGRYKLTSDRSELAIELQRKMSMADAHQQRAEGVQRLIRRVSQSEQETENDSQELAG